MTLFADILSPADLKKLDKDGLAAYAAQVHDFLVDSLAATGGHIGASLATLELSIALHYVFESPQDKILWDTGHQGYTHKIITGRAGKFPTLNSKGGMSRFIDRQESIHDTMDATHAGTAISTALGIALARKLQQHNGYTIAVVGDGALAEGLSWEGLNHAAAEQDTRLILILNDNGFAISPGFGALHNYLAGRKAGDTSPDTLFSSLGLAYIGPVDGHSLSALIPALEAAKQAGKLPIVHVKTEKGHGLPPAANHPYRMHFSFPFDKETGKGLTANASLGYPDYAGQVIHKAMEQDEKIVAITPSTRYATGLEPVFKAFPDRCYDPGMEEQHAMSLTAGFALEGYKPVIFYQSTFMQRAFDQLLHDVCYMNLPVLVLAARSGFAGYDGATHHGIYDFSYLRGLPNLTMLYPKDRFELERMITESLTNLSGPVWIGMPYGLADEIDAGVLQESPLSFAQAEQVLDGRDVLLVTVGNCFKQAKAAVDQLRQEGVAAGLVNLRYLKPLPAEQLTHLFEAVNKVVTVEENILDGGIGSAVAELLVDRGMQQVELLRLGIPCSFVAGGSAGELTAECGIDTKGILAAVQKRWPKLCKQ